MESSATPIEFALGIVLNAAVAAEVSVFVVVLVFAWTTF